ncbi:DUF4249 family protein [Rhizosphaericola mali]|uniref:DUF4249 domain-containing protein n=1 Tax=Rhizosphaericola mali TaxID=2545455 RepID=A0A5P2G685_9BACT|nr:DUF4249 family protein [Rhizosphaericola mali]QES89749.1 DUF4249 domain-containing protein [Rhizosphaericola mali]
MKKIYKLIILLFLYSCEKNITVKLTDAKTMNVIYASVTDYSSMQATLSESVSFYADNSFPAISGAIVNILDSNTNLGYSLSEMNYAGYYTNSKRGKQGSIYKLSVNINDTIYTASAQMPYRVHLDSITFQQQNILGIEIIQPILHFQDPIDTTNYYRIIVTNISSGKINSFNLNDRLSDGRYMHYTLDYDSSYIHEKDTLEIELRSQNRASYNYFSQIENSAGASAKNAINTAPDNPESNLTNGALGLFDIYSRSFHKVLVPSSIATNNYWSEIWLK